MPERPLSGRELNQQHKALIDAGASPEFTLAWLKREADLWILELPRANESDDA